MKKKEKKNEKEKKVNVMMFNDDLDTLWARYNSMVELLETYQDKVPYRFGRKMDDHLDHIEGALGSMSSNFRGDYSED